MTCGSVAFVAVALAAVYAWHRLRGPVPLVAWAISLCARPRWDDAAKLEDVLAELRVPRNGVVQVACRPRFRLFVAVHTVHTVHTSPFGKRHL